METNWFNKNIILQKSTYGKIYYLDISLIDNETCM